MNDRPLLAEWDTPFGVPPFDRIESEDFGPAFREAMRRHRDEVEAIATDPAPPTFDNTIVALERSGRALARVHHVFSSVEAAHTDDVLRATNREVAPLLAGHQDSIVLDRRLFERVRAVFDARATLDLDAESARLLEETHKRFVRSGAALEPAAQERLKEINAELASLSQRFGENLLEETNAFALHVSDEADLGTLPASLKSAAAAEARRQGHDSGWVITLQRPSCEPFLDHSPNRELRRRVFDAYVARADRGNDHDNNDLVARMAELRAERAHRLGYRTHADYVLSDAMAASPDRVRALLDRVWEPALERACRERDARQEMLRADGVDDDLRAWDWRTYTARIRERDYDLDDERTRPYFELTAVRDGCFAVAERLYGIRLVRRDDLPTWHPDQEAYQVVEEDGRHTGVVYFDFFTRSTKTAGAWMTELVEQHRIDDAVAPVVTNTFNFPPASEDEPSLLSFVESKTLFHEFGHALHGLLSDVTFPSLSGTNVPRDFVEFPSQVLENWFDQPETLRMFARHHRTGEVIPDALVEKIREAATFNQGYETVEYLAAAYLDLAWHSLEHGDARVDDPAAFEIEQMKRIGLIDAIVPRYRSPYFAHVFAGGYAASYYSYLWSEVLDADGFGAFLESDLFDRATAGRLRTLLSRGGTEPGMELYRAFRGREPAIDPLLERRGLVASGEPGA